MLAQLPTLLGGRLAPSCALPSAHSGVQPHPPRAAVTRRWRAPCDRQARRRGATMSGAVANAAAAPAILVNGCTGKMGRATAEAVVRRGLTLAPVAFSASKAGQSETFGGVEVKLRPFDDSVMQELMRAHPGLVVVDYTVPDAVNANAEFYVRNRVPFVMGTTGGDRERLLTEVGASGVYAVIAPQMGKQLVAFQGALELLATNFPGAFAGYTLAVREAHQSTKVDTSGTAKAIVSSFQRLGLDFDVSQIEKVRDRAGQLAMGVPEEHLAGHAYHTYTLRSPDGLVTLEFKHNVCGRSIYAEGTVDAAAFLAQRAKEKASKTLYTMVDVLAGGALR